MRYILLTILLITAIGIEQTYAYDQTLYPTIPGTNVRDYSAPGYVQEGNTIYQTIPGTNVRDYSAPGYRIDGNSMYQTLPGTNIRDYSAPGYRIGN